MDTIVPSYNDMQFKEHFRLSRHVYNDLRRQYQVSTYYQDNCDGKDGKLGADHELLTYLWFFGHQTASFRDVGDRFDISISTLYEIIS